MRLGHVMLVWWLQGRVGMNAMQGVMSESMQDDARVGFCWSVMTEHLGSEILFGCGDKFFEM
jgi:hypothetical protein